MDKKIFGIEMLMDLHKCDKSTFTKENLENYFIELSALKLLRSCKVIELLHPIHLLKI